MTIQKRRDLQSQRNGITVEFAPVSLAENLDLVSHLVKIVNDSYAESEERIWVKGYERTTVSEMQNHIRGGELVIAQPDAENPDGSALPIGCVLLREISDTVNSYGMLALDESQRGTGVGRDLVVFTEDYSRASGYTIMQVELLVPTEYNHPFKTRLQAWYERLGYKVVKLGIFADEYPRLAPYLASRCEYRIFEKPFN